MDSEKGIQDGTSKEKALSAILQRLNFCIYFKIWQIEMPVILVEYLSIDHFACLEVQAQIFIESIKYRLEYQIVINSSYKILIY